MSDVIHGMSMQQVAEIMSKDGELKAQYGERNYKPHFHQYLTEQGLASGCECGGHEHAWAHAWNGWHSRMEADPTGQLWAKFSTIQQQLSMKAHMADVPDASQDAKEGVTLDSYAKIMAGIAGGKEYKGLLAENGVGEDQWQKAQAGWNAAMAADTEHHLTTQYGTLYAKYTPGFQANMEAQTAAIMAQRHDDMQNADMQDDEPEVEYTIEMAIEALSSKKPRERRDGARYVQNRWEWDKATLDAPARKSVEIMVDTVESSGDWDASDREGAAGSLKEYAAGGFFTREQADDIKGSIARCQGRGVEKLATLQAAFAPIANKAVPERVKMQSQIQDFESMTETLAEILEEWDDNFSAPEAASAVGSASSAAASMGVSNPAASIQPSSGGFMSVLKSIPILGNILRMLGM